VLTNFLHSIAEIDETSWNALWPNQYPFTQHAFLDAVERSGSVRRFTDNDTGWQSRHLIITDSERLVAAVPLFIKTHSYGEYVFDWSWANAYHQAGIEYYPKLLNAIPFTPATGPRLGFASYLTDTQKNKCFSLAVDAIRKFVEKESLSGFHVLFPEKNDAALFSGSKFTKRLGYQFHWFNQNYIDFSDFLDTFASRKRKNLKKERRKIQDQDLEIRMRPAENISPEEWETFYSLYHRTYMKRSGHAGYLGKEFFFILAEKFPQNVLLASAHHRGDMIAAALYFRDETTLYGRYWGTQIDIDGLHFECCYYQGIEYAIAHRLQRFDPGAQGEHKIQRGFTPVKTQSYHWLSHPAFDQAINEFTNREQKQIDFYLRDARTLLPFKEGIEMPSDDVLLGP